MKLNVEKYRASLKGVASYDASYYGIVLGKAVPILRGWLS